MSEDRKVLIIGSDGMIGSRLLSSWPVPGWAAVGTTRRPDAGPGRLRLDLRKDAGGWVPPEGVEAAVLCAGVTRLKDCRRDPEGSAKINVRGMLALAENLAARGIFLVYVSTSQVFDGSRPKRAAGDAPCPVTEYGRQLAGVESELRSWKEKAAVVRIAKVLGGRLPLFEGWREDLLVGKPVYPFSDMGMAPVPLWFAAETLGKVASLRSSGLFQISGEEDVSYAEIARRLAERLGADAGLVRPVSAEDSGLYDEGVLAHTTFDTSRVEEELGLTPPGVWRTIEDAFFRPEALAERPA